MCGKVPSFEQEGHNMPRPARIHLPGFPQHITQRSNNRQATFYAHDDYRHYLGLLLAACDRHACALHAYLVMTNDEQFL